jgi:hypothetical protein
VITPCEAEPLGNPPMKCGSGQCVWCGKKSPGQGFCCSYRADLPLLRRFLPPRRRWAGGERHRYNYTAHIAFLDKGKRPHSLFPRAHLTAESRDLFGHGICPVSLRFYLGAKEHQSRMWGCEVKVNKNRNTQTEHFARAQGARG